MNRVRTGELPWTTLDELHRLSLDRLLPKFGLTGLSEAEIDDLNKAWHRLRPWPDAVAGLTRLKRKFIIAPLSNGNIALMTNMAKHGGLPWDCILGAELARHYKPDPEVYQSAADFLDLPPAEVMMVAAHLDDLQAAKAVGLKTAFVPRPTSSAPGRSPSGPGARRLGGRPGPGLRASCRPARRVTASGRPETADERFQRVAVIFDAAGSLRTPRYGSTPSGRGSCETSLALTPALLQQHGFAHAGVVTTLADPCGGRGQGRVTARARRADPRNQR